MLRNWSFHFDIQNEGNEASLYEQIALEINRLIESGVLKEGTLLPGSRKIAMQVGVNRKTVMRALALLVEKGILEVEDRKGIVVACQQQKTEDETDIVLERTGGMKTVTPIVIDGGTPDTELLPFLEFSRAYRYFFNLSSRRQMLGYHEPQGLMRFRELVSAMLNQARGMDASAERVCITRGSQMALFLISHTMLKPGDAIAVESPGYLWAMKIFEQAGLRLVQIPVDADGMCVDCLQQAVKNDPAIRAVYVTPRYQYPTTVTMSAERRKKLVELVNHHPICVIEDDFGSDYRFGQRYYRPLSCQLPMDKFFYVGTFSKMFAPAVRVGYVVASEEHIQGLVEMRRLVDMQGDTVMENTLCELIENGDMKRYLKRTLATYHNRLDLFSRLIEMYLKDKVEYTRPNGGLAIWLAFPTIKMSAQQFRELLSTKNILIKHASADAKGQLGIRIGYANLTPMQMENLVLRLSALLAEHS